MQGLSTIPGLTDRSSSIRSFSPPTADGGFEQALHGALSRADGASEKEAQARRSAEEFVSIALVQPILTQLRETNEAAAPFAPGDAERMFGGLWDAEIAQRITSSQQFGLVDIVARQLLRQPSAGAESAPVGASRHA